MTIDARNLSCQGLQNIDPDGQPITFHGDPVIGYHTEMARRGEAHVFGCELIGHRAEPMTPDEFAKIQAHDEAVDPDDMTLGDLDRRKLLAEVKRLREHIAFVLTAARERDKEMLHLRDTHKASKRPQTRGQAWEEAAYEVRKIAELLERVDSPA